MVVKEIQVKNLLTKSNLPSTDFTINPYVGCPHACKYCYASFMKKFTEHSQNWGDFLDVKLCCKKIDVNKIGNKSVLLSSVTDCYNPYEKKYELTKNILEQLIQSDCRLVIITKSNLILRDIEILKRFNNLTVAISLNTINENFKKDMDKASSVHDRLATLKELYSNNIRTVLFMSPVFPYITEWKEIIESSLSFTNEYWFENLNLRGPYRPVIMKYIKEKYPSLYKYYVDIYYYGNNTYWSVLSKKLSDFCDKKDIKYINYFYHELLVKNKKQKNN